MVHKLCFCFHNCIYCALCLTENFEFYYFCRRQHEVCLDCNVALSKLLSRMTSVADSLLPEVCNGSVDDMIDVMMKLFVDDLG